MRMVEKATAHCGPLPAAPPIQNAPSFDALSTSIAIGSAALGVIGLLVAIGGTLFAFEWSKVVKAQAKEVAEETARATAKEWLERNARDVLADEAANLKSALPSVAEQQADMESDLERGGG